ncbi:MAG: Stp1/IreP family PP2C-type Ser/Thr phosphatase [Sandaracinaceae bacterium]|nr:Stp1/IreP family PP2C-type Ser/Thr phosphatase [Sandaracinaceae bacterium]
MNFIAAGLSDVGLQREHNEDSFCIAPEFRLFIVADGMGGHRAGDVASKMAIHAVSSFFESTKNEDATWPFAIDPSLSLEENRLIAGIRLANLRIFETSVQNYDMAGMGTTVVSLLYHPPRQKAYVAHVGDSRAYRVRGNEIALLTRDHSLVNDYLAAMPNMPQEQLDELPKNVITRALGMQEGVMIDLTRVDVEPGDIFLLCSDGLSGMLSDEQIGEIVLDHADDLEEGVKALIRRANEEGGDDNITAVLIKTGD